MLKITIQFLLFSFLLSNESLNMNLISNLTFDEELSDIIGFSQDGREIAVVGLESSTVLVDVTNPFIPYEIVRIPGGISSWRDIKYWNRHLYVGTEAITDNGIQIISVDNIDNPILVNVLNDFGPSHNLWIDNDGFLYVLGVLQDCDIWIYTLQNPEFPEQVGCWQGEYIHDIDVLNNKLYAAAINSSTIYILDIEEKNNIEILTSWTYPGEAHDCSITSDEKFLITADEMLSGHLKIWNIEDYDNVELIGEYAANLNHSAHNVYVRNNLVFTSYYADGTRVIDITNPSEPVEVAYYDTSNIEGLYVGNWGVYPFLPSNYIISSDIESGLFIFDLNGIVINHSEINIQSHFDEYYQVEFDLIELNSYLSDAKIYFRNFTIDNEWTNLNLNTNNNTYYANIPKQNNGSVIQYYIEVTDHNEMKYYYNEYDADNPMFFIVGQLPTIISENFEEYTSSINWNLSDNSNALNGNWERGIPNGTQLNNIHVQPYEDHTENGYYCFMTGNLMTDDPYFDDVESGSTILISPTYDLIEYDNLIFSFAYWFSNSLGDNPQEDFFSVDVSNDLGQNWISLKNTNIPTNNWEETKIVISDQINMTEEMIFRFTVSDINDSSLVEAAIDDIEILAFGYPYNFGDVNFDNNIDIIDIVFILGYIQSNFLFNLFQEQNADFNQDNIINVLDIVTIVEFILAE